MTRCRAGARDIYLRNLSRATSSSTLNLKNIHEICRRTTDTPLRPYSDSLLGARLVIDSTESVGCIFNTASETRNAARQTHSSNTKALPVIGRGTRGLKSTVIARNPAAQKYLLARRACATTRRPETQTTTSKIAL